VRDIVKKSKYSNFSAREWLDEGKRLKEKKRHKEAIAAFNLAIQKNCRYAEAYFARGACHYLIGNYRQSGDDLDAAALFGCREAQLWSVFGTKPSGESADDDEN
jgi:tetratricopeptide (TPR) repeat protein